MPKGYLAFGMLLTCLAGTRIDAQDIRYEQGRRLRAMERAWDKTEDPTAHERATKSIDSAVRSFLSLRGGETSRFLDEATLLLSAPESEIKSTQRWAAALTFQPEARLIDASQEVLHLEARLAYPIDPPIIDRVGIHFSFLGSGAATLPEASTVELKTSELPQSIPLRVEGLPPSDLTLHFAIFSGKVLVGRGEFTISVIERLHERLRAAEAKIAAWPVAMGVARVDRATALGLLSQLQALAQGKTMETDIPAARRLDLLEKLIASATNQPPEPFFGGHRRGEFWISLPCGKDKSYTVPARLFVPESKDERTARPLVVALHGTGGSENMFFEGYGLGAVVRLCQARDWIVVAPRSSLVGTVPVADIVDALAELYPVDRANVFLVGHSLGAEQAVAAAARDPKAYAAVAALGGGGSIEKNRDSLRDVPFFIGIGDADFMKRRAEALNRALLAAGARHVKYQEYPGIEHLLIVQVGLRDVFDFFDAAIRPKANP